MDKPLPPFLPPVGPYTSYHWPAPAKLNLFLYITGRRADGYHQLQTLFQFLDFCDDIIITPRDDHHLILTTPLPGVTDNDNLVLRAARLLQHHARQQPSPACCLSGASIAIKKRIPMGGGLGGGSSDAASVLVALNQLWQTGFTVDQLAQIGLQLGADVPVFVRGQAAIAEGVGEQLTPVTPSENCYIVAHPGLSVSTASVFNDAELPRHTPQQSHGELLNNVFRNDCEAIVRKRYPKVDRALRWLLEYAPARLTGTGSCVFAECSNRATAEKILQQAPEWLHCFVAQGVNISPLWQAVPGKRALVRR